MSAATDQDVARYVERVRAALADLPAGRREELLEELPDHLAEVAAEGEGPLESRLGPPEEYAAELRATAGLPGASPGRMTAAVAGLRGRLRTVDTRFGPILGYAHASEFLRLLRPAWWVLRGYVAAMVVVSLIDATGPIGLLPRLGGSILAAVVILAGFVLLSIWLGRRADRLSRWPRRVLLAGSGLLVLFAVVGFVNADQRARSDHEVYREVYYDRFSNIRDVFPYDAQGRLLTNVRLFDQDGRPIDLGWKFCAKAPIVEKPSGVLAYPRCPEHDPFRPPAAIPRGVRADGQPKSNPEPEPVVAGPAFPSMADVVGYRRVTPCAISQR
jgi:hypothetical protein